MELIRTLKCLAKQYEKDRQFSESETMYREAIDVYCHSKMLSHYDMALALMDFANLKKNMNQPFAAIDVSEQALSLLYGAYYDKKLSVPISIFYEKCSDCVIFLESLYISVKEYNKCCKLWEGQEQLMKTFHDGKQFYYFEPMVSLSYYYILTRQYDRSEEYSCKALYLFPTEFGINKNLAAALLFQGKYAEAEKLYRQYKDELKDNFLNDFKQYAEASVIPKEYEADVEKIKKMLNE